MRLVLPMPPSVNNQYVTVNGRRALSKEAAAYKRAVRDHLRREIAAGRVAAAELARLESAFLALFIDFYFETPLRRDLDGGLKITQDAICETLRLNDNRIVDIHLIKRIDPLRPRIEIELEAVDGWEFDQQYVVMPPA
ncbi:MAG: RusA family crossover junction endodeoxyribonuclease [Chloroflexi bacterium]|nr:RusA family crossover junction endodeoxyribonuclease [Chloroflexota bacterium]